MSRRTRLLTMLIGPRRKLKRRTISVDGETLVNLQYLSQFEPGVGLRSLSAVIHDLAQAAMGKLADSKDETRRDHVQRWVWDQRCAAEQSASASAK